MNAYTKPRVWILVAIAVGGLVLAQQFWQWEVERVEVHPGEYLILVHRWGKDLPEDDIVAPDDSFKGVMLKELPEGRHFINPLFWSHERHKIINVPQNHCLVLTRLYGRAIPSERLARGEILAGEGERGLVEEVLLPGSYRLNPYAYTWKEVPAIAVGLDQVGVHILKVGLDPRKLPAVAEHGRYVVPKGYRGIQDQYLTQGTYFLNPYVEAIVPVEVRSHRVELTDIEFPSRDGFILKPRVVVEYRVQRSHAAEMLVRLTDEGTLHQEDDTPEKQAANEILQKVILPHIRGYARIVGSNFDARDFITVALDTDQKEGNTREVLQKKLFEKVKPRCAELGIEVLAVTVADLKPPEELADQISQRDLARVEQEKHRSKINQLKALQKLKATQTLKEQNTAKVAAGTRLIMAQTQAKQQTQVQELKLKQELESAQLRLEAAKLQAEATLTNGKAEATVINADNEAQVSGLRTAVQAFGSAASFAQYQMIARLAPALSEIFASDESEFARIFSSYMAPLANPPPLRTVLGSPGSSSPSTVKK